MMKSTRISTLFSAVLFLAVLPSIVSAYTVNTVEVVSAGNGANEALPVLYRSYGQRAHCTNGGHEGGNGCRKRHD